MEKLLIVNADDFGLSKGQNYGVIEAYQHGVVSSTTAMVNGGGAQHAAALSRQYPADRAAFRFDPWQAAGRHAFAGQRAWRTG